MWVYTGDDDARLRLAIEGADGFWLDYWLFLHADETDRVWSCRPIGIGTLGNLALKARHPIDQRLIESLCQDITAYTRLRGFMPMLPDVPITQAGATQWPKVWHYWLLKTQDADFRAELRCKLADELITALERGELTYISFLSRRLASELSEVYPSDRSVLQATLNFVLRGNTDIPFRKRLHQFLTTPILSRDFLVKFRVAPVSISSRAANYKQYPTGTKLIFESAPEWSHQSRLLTSINISVQASDPESATARALGILRQVFEELRLRHYVRTNIFGAAAIFDLRETPEIENEPVYVPLAQPFWVKKSGRRKVPSLPARAPQDPAWKEQWNASRWHISQAIGVWSEDIHTAASEVWQALEAFGGKLGKLKNETIPAYLEFLPKELLSYTAGCLNLQHGKHRQVMGACDWYFWQRETLDIVKWLGRVTHPASLNHWSKWRQPVAPAFLFDKDAGILQILGKDIRGVERMRWMPERLSNDIRYLYGIRNAVVHKGERLAPDRWVAFLARLGLELLLAVLNHKLAAE